MTCVQILGRHAGDYHWTYAHWPLALALCPLATSREFVSGFPFCHYLRALSELGLRAYHLAWGPCVFCIPKHNDLFEARTHISVLFHVSTE